MQTQASQNAWPQDNPCSGFRRRHVKQVLVVVSLAQSTPSEAMTPLCCWAEEASWCKELKNSQYLARRVRHSSVGERPWLGTWANASKL